MEGGSSTFCSPELYGLKCVPAIILHLHQEIGKVIERYVLEDCLQQCLTHSLEYDFYTALSLNLLEFANHPLKFTAWLWRQDPQCFKKDPTGHQVHQRGIRANYYVVVPA
jgi:hypothetical protein